MSKLSELSKLTARNLAYCLFELGLCGDIDSPRFYGLIIRFEFCFSNLFNVSANVSSHSWVGVRVMVRPGAEAY